MCAGTLQRVLSRQLGARQFGFDLDTGEGWFLPPEDAGVDPDGAARTVRAAGFELLELRLDARGRLEWDPSGVAWLVPEKGEHRLARLVDPASSVRPGTEGVWRVRGRLQQGAAHDFPFLVLEQIAQVAGR